MKPTVKIVFSEEELKVINDTSFLRSKAIITNKVVDLFHQLKHNLEDYIITHELKLPEVVEAKSSKISRGENYQGLPYTILDYPRHLKKQEVFAFRSMVWWGNQITFTLHLKGNYLDEKRSKLIENASRFNKQDFICTNTDEWDHHLGSDNYTLMQNLEKPELVTILKNHRFIKICRATGLENLEKIPLLGQKAFEDFYKLYS